MLDPKIIRDQPEKIKKMLQDRQVEFDFDKIPKLLLIIFLIGKLVNGKVSLQSLHFLVSVSKA